MWILKQVDSRIGSADLERPVQLPGEPERKTEHERRKNGITLDDNTWQQIVSTAENLGITR